MGPTIGGGFNTQDGVSQEVKIPVPDYSFLSPCKKCVVRVICNQICPPLKTFNKRKENIKIIFPAASRIMFGIMAVAVGLLIFIKCMGEMKG